MTNVYVLPDAEAMPNIKKFREEIAPSTYRCMLIVEKPSPITHEKWANVFHDTRWAVDMLIDAHDKLVAHIAKLYLYKKYSQFFSYVPLDYERVLDSVLDNVTLDLYHNPDMVCFSDEVIRHFEHMDELYQEDIKQMIDEDVMDSIVDGHIENVTFSSSDMMLSMSI